MRTDAVYTPSDVFETFPFATNIDEKITLSGEKYHTLRQELCSFLGAGLTKIYNQVNSPEDQSMEIGNIRDRQKHLDEGVLDAYGWHDIDLDHGFYLDDQPFTEDLLEGLEGNDRKKKLNEVRYTISPAARKEVLKRLLKLNHERHAEEVAKGWWEKNEKTGKWKVTKTGKAWLKKTREAERKARLKAAGIEEKPTPVLKPETPLFGSDY